MKPIIPFALLGALFAIGTASAVSTTPVGYITHEIAGNTGGLTAGAVTYISPSLILPSVFTGSSTVSPSGGNVITFSGGVPAGLGAGDLLELTGEGSTQGWWVTITSSDATANTVTVNTPFPAGLPANTSVSIRPHTTVKAFLGANTPGLTPFDGAAANDEILLLNPETQVTTTIAYVPAAISGAPQDGWFDLGLSASADDYIIEPGTSVQVKRFAATPLSFASTGEVKVVPTQVDIFPKFNWVGNFTAVGSTLNGMGYATSLILFDGANSNFDQLQFINPDQSASTFAAVDPSFFGAPTVGNLGDSTDAGNVNFPEGEGAVLIRASSEAASTITIPGSTVTP